MSLEIRKSSQWWYGVFIVGGHKSIINLKVPITGKRPPKRTMQGDDEFEQSRGRALEAYERLAKEMADDRTGEKAIQKLAELKDRSREHGNGDADGGGGEYVSPIDGRGQGNSHWNWPNTGPHRQRFLHRGAVGGGSLR